jgi:hypothetical protein
MKPSPIGRLSKTVAIALAVMALIGVFEPRANRCRRVEMEVFGFECLNILQTVNDHRPDLSDISAPCPATATAPTCAATSATGQPIAFAASSPSNSFFFGAPLYADARCIPPEHLDVLDTEICGRDRRKA